MFIVIQGSGGARVSSEGHDACSLYGLGKSYHRNDAERLGHLLVLKRVLAEHMVIGNHDNVISYVKLGPKALDFLQGRVKVMNEHHLLDILLKVNVVLEWILTVNRAFDACRQF